MQKNKTQFMIPLRLSARVLEERMSHLSSKFPRSLLKGNYSLYEVQDLGTAHTWWFGRRRSCSGGSGRPPVRDRCSCLVCCCCCCGGSDASRFALLTPCSPCTKPQMLMIVIESCVSVPGHSCRFHLLPPLQIPSGEISAARSVNIPLHLAADARKTHLGRCIIRSLWATLPHGVASQQGLVWHQEVA